jgi:hypothetical protein
LALVNALGQGFVICDALQEFKSVQDGLRLAGEARERLRAAELWAVQVDAY